MGKTDIYESDYLENKEIFADLINGILYEGEQVVSPQELSEQDGELRSISGNQAKKMIRDKVRLWNGTTFAVLAVENQTKVDYHMVTRVMLSESMEYDRQWKKLRRTRETEKARLPSDEFMFGMHKEDKFIPVITIIIYYGKEKPWDGAKTLHELLDTNGNGDKILPFISDYRLNIFDYHEYDDFEQFHSELRFVFEFLKYAGNKESLRERLEKNKERYKNLSSEAKVLLTHLTNIKNIPGVKKEELERGEFDMCKAFEDMKEEGRQEGIAEGIVKGRAEEIIETGCEFKLSDDRILERLQHKLDISMEEARKFFAMFKTGNAIG